MFWPFRRRPRGSRGSRGRHALAPGVAPTPPRAAPAAAAWSSTGPLPVPPVAVPAPPSGPRVQLGFRDGSSAELDPASAQARALEGIAQALTRRD